MFIKKITPKIIKNSRKEKTIQLTIKTYKGTFTASAPSGKSKGKHEQPAYNEQGIEKTLTLLKKISKLLQHKNIFIKKLDDLWKIHIFLQKFEKKYGTIGANATYVIEAALLKAASADNKKPVWKIIYESLYPKKKPRIPMPVGNCIGGGLHTKSKKHPDFQEFLLISQEKRFSTAITKNYRAYMFAKTFLKTKKKNDENAWITPQTNEQTLKDLKTIADRYNLKIGLDIAASTFFKAGYYHYKNKELIRDRTDQLDYIKRLIKKFKIFYVEDPLEEEDFSGFKELVAFAKENKLKTLIVGDDLTTTNPSRVKRAIRAEAITGIIIKPNQIGSLLKVAEVVKMCKEAKIKIIFSHRSGETLDNILADYAVGFQADFIKSGIFGKERLIKLKRIADIEKEIAK